MKLIEDARLLLRRDPRPRVRHADGEVTVDRLGSHAHFADVRELDGVPDEIKEYLGQALLIAEANGQGLSDLSLERKFLVLCQRFGGKPNGLNHALDGVLG